MITITLTDEMAKLVASAVAGQQMANAYLAESDQASLDVLAASGPVDRELVDETRDMIVHNNERAAVFAEASAIIDAAIREQSSPDFEVA